MQCRSCLQLCLEIMLGTLIFVILYYINTHAVKIQPGYFHFKIILIFLILNTVIRTT